MQRSGSMPEWTFIKMKNGKYLFLSSEKAVTFLSQQYSVAKNNIADMRSIPEEIIIDGKKGLNKFNKILDNLTDLNANIIIHCKMGLNRTPVTAAIFLVEKMSYTPAQAQQVVEKALKKRNPDYTLDEKGHYRTILQMVEIDSEVIRLNRRPSENRDPVNCLFRN